MFVLFGTVWSKVGARHGILRRGFQSRRNPQTMRPRYSLLSPVVAFSLLGRGLAGVLVSAAFRAGPPSKRTPADRAVADRHVVELERHASRKHACPGQPCRRGGPGVPPTTTTPAQRGRGLPCGPEPVINGRREHGRKRWALTPRISPQIFSPPSGR